MSNKRFPLWSTSMRRSVSRRNFIRGAAGAGFVFGSGLWKALPASASGPGVPNPIPHVNVNPFGSFHFFFPGPPDSTNPTTGHDPSVITDFNGFVGQADLLMSGTGTDTTTGESAPYMFHTDMRFMMGEFVGTDGQNHSGAFAFI